ncbi:MAG TPA: YigZ family protein [Bacteroidales bacterium]|nr:YigZ family protein [Bacteroidales bacterium]
MTSIEHYRTIAGPSEGLFKDRGSKFLSFAFPVSSEEEIKELLEELRHKFHDARHHCYAYRLGMSGDVYRTNDDGEPSNSAGKPIHGQLVSYDLTNVLIVVIRYFGGTLLGVGGLINAYRSAASDAIEHAIILTKLIKEIYMIRFGYPEMNEVMRIMKEENPEDVKYEFETECRITLSLPVSGKQRILDRLNIIENVKTEYLRTI